MRKISLALACVCLGLSISATTAVAQPNKSGRPPIDIDPSSRGPVSGIGIESRDILAMTDQMMRDMLSVPELAGRAKPPRVIIDSEFFKNESTQRINKNIITDRLRVNLNRASKGRLTFVGREYADMVAQERELEREGVTDVGTTGVTRAVAGADFRLGGRITSIDQVQPKTGLVQRYTQITFEMIDLENQTIVWSNIYEFERSAADDIIYR